ncbi:MAG: helix-turn-helix domain-containing protein [Cellulophaga sp.]
MLKSYDANLKQQVSNYERMNRKWVRALFMIYITSLSIILLSYVASIMSPTIPTAVFQLSFRVIYIIGILLIAFIALKDTTIFSNIVFEEGSAKSGKRYENSKINNDKKELLNTKLIDYMTVEEPYLEPRLTLKQLSIELEMSAHILSQIINEVHSQNFYDFVNSYRVKHLKELLDDKQYKSKTLLAIALESGFNSKATFNKVFKKLTNQTPSEYIKNKN